MGRLRGQGTRPEIVRPARRLSRLGHLAGCSGDHQMVATVAANGQLTTYRYDACGNRILQVRYDGTLPMNEVYPGDTAGSLLFKLGDDLDMSQTQVTSYTYDTHNQQTCVMTWQGGDGAVRLGRGVLDTRLADGQCRRCA